jgi:hypothetical protein
LRKNFSLLSLPKRIVVVTVAVDTIGVQLVDVFSQIDCEKATTCRIGIKTTRRPVLLDFRIDKGMVEQKVDLIPLNSFVIHDTVADENSSHVNLLVSLSVVGIVLVN